MRTQRTGMAAYLGIAQQVAREREEALIAALQAWVEQPVAATRIGNTNTWQTHYGAGVRVTQRKHRYVVLTTRY